MLNFFRIRSRMFISFTWLLLFALFADTVNLDDYLPNSASIHLDDIDMSNTNVVEDMLTALTGNTFALSKEAKRLDGNPVNKQKKDLLILYDLDSLCLAADYSFEKETLFSQTFSHNTELIIATSSRIESPQNLFILFQSFII